MSSFNKTTVSLSETKIFDPLVLDYLEEDPKTSDLFLQSPNLEGLEKGLENQFGRKIDRRLLVTVLKDQYAFLSSEIEKKSIYKSIDSLLDDEAHTICTGHQLNLFTGPLYTILKIITTIQCAQKLSLRTGKKIIPVFWLASEDHDMDEINHIYIYGQRYEWPVDWAGPSGKSSCRGIQTLISSLRDKFEKSEEALPWLNLLAESYRPEDSLSIATRKFLHALFGKYGLIILDPDEARLKQEFIPEMINDITNRIIDKCVTSTTDKMPKEYKVQVHPRTVNLFYLTDNKRIRIDFDDNHFKLQDGSQSWTEEEIKIEISDSPERFSPNVLLRPLYQEKILPNIAMVGGPAEVAYWLELKSTFISFGIPFPVLLLRNSVMFLDLQTLIRMKKLKLDTSNLFETLDEWIRNYIKNGPIENFSVEDSMQDISSSLSAMIKSVEKIDPTLVGALEAENSRIQKALKGFEEKVLRSIKRKNETEINQLQKLHEKIFPFGKLQERTENVLPYLFKYGAGFIDELMKTLDPFSNKVFILEEKSMDQLVIEKKSLH